jgi:tRNA(Ile)-lysidine synthase
MKNALFTESVFKSCQLTLDSPLVVGVSGGPDSMCLLDALARLEIPLIVAHFDHSLRPDSQRDAQVVRAAAQRLKLPFVLSRQNVADYAARMHLSVEEAARILRYQFLFAQAREHAAQAVAVGHNADDQVETVLMHLLRGSGISGLKGMAFRTILPDWDACIPLVRPLLPFSRQEILAYCQEHGLEPVQDESNQDRNFLRNRLRHELIPLLETYNPQVRQAVWRTARVLEGEEAVLQASVEAAWEGCLVEASASHLALRLPALQQMIPGLLRSVLRRSMAHFLPHLRDVDFSVIERAAGFVQHPGAGSMDLVHGLVLFAEAAPDGAARLVIASAGSLPSDASWAQMLAQTEQIIPIPGTVELASGWQLRADLLDLYESAEPDRLRQSGDRWEAWLDADVVPENLQVRPPRPGDRFQPLGMQGHFIKLSDFWINQKLPRRARAAWPLVAAGDEILWIPGYRLAHPYRIQKTTRKVLHLRVVRLDTENL